MKIQNLKTFPKKEYFRPGEITILPLMITITLVCDRLAYLANQIMYWLDNNAPCLMKYQSTITISINVTNFGKVLTGLFYA